MTSRLGRNNRAEIAWARSIALIGKTTPRTDLSNNSHEDLRVQACAISGAVGLAPNPLRQSLAQALPAPFMKASRYNAAGPDPGTIAPDPDGSEAAALAAASRTTYDVAGRPIAIEIGELSSWLSEDVAPANWTGFTVLSHHHEIA